MLGEISRPDGGERYKIVVAMAGNPGTASGLTTTLQTFRRWRPRYVVVAGIAGGLPKDNLSKGDVVVSTTICGYELGKIESDFTPRATSTYQPDNTLITAALSIPIIDNGWNAKIIASPPRTGIEPKMLPGAIASGDKVVDNVASPFFQAVMRIWPKLIAIEMEGAGSAAAIRSLQEEGESVGFLMIRGISDMPITASIADTSHGSQTIERDQWKDYAADAAAAFTTSLIRHAWPVAPA